MKILIDESLPRYVKMMVQNYTSSTVQERGWSGMKNGTLLAHAEDEFDVFLTADQNLRYQHNLTGRRIGIVTGRSPDNSGC